MHACGHDGHTAMLLATLNALHERRDELTGDPLHLPARGGARPGRACELVAAGVMEGVDLVVGAHLFSLDPLGKVGVLPAHTAASDVFGIEIRGKGRPRRLAHESVDL